MHVVLTVLVLIALALALISLLKLTAFQAEVLKEKRSQGRLLASLSKRLDTLDDKLAAVEKNVQKALKPAATVAHSHNPGSVPAATAGSMTKKASGKVEAGRNSIQEPLPVAPVKKPETTARQNDAVTTAQSAPATQTTPETAEPSPAEATDDVPARKQEDESKDKYINFDCLYCLQNIDAPFTMVGENIRCPTCSKIISVPRTSTNRLEHDKPVDTAAGTSGKDDDEFINEKTVRIDISNAELMPESQKRKVFIKRQ